MSLSPDSETFSTPPMTPTIFSLPEEQPPRATLSRRSSRPSSLCIQHSSGEWTPDIVLDQPSEPLSKLSNGLTMPALGSAPSTDYAPKSPRKESQPHAPVQHRLSKQPMKSPCFVHSLLDKGASFQDWLQQSRAGTPIGVSQSLGNCVAEQFQLKQPPGLPMPQPELVQESPSSSQEDEDDEGLLGTGSLTRQLAKTAVGVREMSKQLGV